MKIWIEKIISASILIGVLGIVSKLMGAFRVMAIGWKFGQGIETDAYNAAIKVTMVSMSIIGAAIFTALVPVLANVKEKYGTRGKFKFFNNISNIVLVLALFIGLVTYIFAPVIIKIMFTSFQKEKFDLAVSLTRLAVPIIPALALMNLVTGYLHSFNIYGPYAFMGIPYNLVFFIYLFAFPISIEGLIMATFLANLTQIIIQLPQTFKTGFRPRPLIDLKDPFVPKMIGLIIPVAIGQAAQQINIIIDQNLASGLADGVITALDNASKINDSIIAIFITGFTTVMFPLLSEAFEKKDNEKILSLVDSALGAVFLITIPATIGIMVLSKDLIRVMFERYMFTKNDTLVTAGAFFYYSLGLTGQGLRMLFSKVYYSLQDTKTPMINGLFAVGINIALDLILIKFMGHKGLALATSLAITISTLYLIYGLRKKIPEINFTGFIIEFVKILISSAIMGIAVYFVNSTLNGLGIVGFTSILIDIVIAFVVYLIMIVITRVKSIDLYVGAIKKS